MSPDSLQWNPTGFGMIGLLLLVAGSLTGVFWFLAGGTVFLAVSSIGIAKEVRALARRSRVTPLLVPHPDRDGFPPEQLLPSANVLGPSGDRVVAFLRRVATLSPDEWSRLDEVLDALEQYRFEPTARREQLVLKGFARVVRESAERDRVLFRTAASTIDSSVEKLIEAGALPPVNRRVKREILNVAQGLLLREHIPASEWSHIVKPFVPFFTRAELA